MAESKLPEDLCVHIFSASAAMVGVCITVIGLIRVSISLRRADTLADDIVAVDSLLFLSSCLLSYWAMRSRHIQRSHSIERLADLCFLSALVLMVGACIFITYEITVV